MTHSFRTLAECVCVVKKWDGDYDNMVNAYCCKFVFYPSTQKTTPPCCNTLRRASMGSARGWMRRRVLNDSSAQILMLRWISPMVDNSPIGSSRHFGNIHLFKSSTIEMVFFTFSQRIFGPFCCHAEFGF